MLTASLWPWAGSLLVTLLNPRDSRAGNERQVLVLWDTRWLRAQERLSKADKILLSILGFN